jgi:alcohol dehydrogenase YqhD (iron-dependent ADH family)
LKDFFASLGLPVSLEQLGASVSDIDALVDTLRINQGETIGGFRLLDMDDARTIYQIASENAFKRRV